MTAVTLGNQLYSSWPPMLTVDKSSLRALKNGRELAISNLIWPYTLRLLFLLMNGGRLKFNIYRPCRKLAWTTTRCSLFTCGHYWEFDIRFQRLVEICHCRRPAVTGRIYSPRWPQSFCSTRSARLWITCFVKLRPYITFRHIRYKLLTTIGQA